MFNTYQELVDRINELLKERKKLNNKIKRLEDLYSKIPVDYIITMYVRHQITEEEYKLWAILNYKKLKKAKNLE